jgi:hypothetical protein
MVDENEQGRIPGRWILPIGGFDAIAVNIKIFYGHFNI